MEFKPKLKYLTVEELAIRWNCSLDTILDLVLEKELILFGRVKTLSGQKFAGKSSFLGPIPLCRIEDSLELIASKRVMLKDRIIGHHPISKFHLSEYPEEQILLVLDVFSVDQSIVEFQLIETKFTELKVPLGLIEKIEQHDLEEIVIDINKSTVCFKGYSYDFTPDQMKIIKVIAEQKQKYDLDEKSSPWIEGIDAITASGSSSSKITNIMRSNDEKFKQIIEQSNTKRGIYRIKGKKITIKHQN